MPSCRHNLQEKISVLSFSTSFTVIHFSLKQNKQKKRNALNSILSFLSFPKADKNIPNSTKVSVEVTPPMNGVADVDEVRLLPLLSVQSGAPLFSCDRLKCHSDSGGGRRRRRPAFEPGLAGHGQKTDHLSRHPAHRLPIVAHAARRQERGDKRTQPTVATFMNKPD